MSDFQHPGGGGATSEDDELVPISALQHVVYCERRAALVHVERLWHDNAHTANGQAAHGRVDHAGVDRRRGVRIDRSLPLRSHKLKLVGVADLVEWERHDALEIPRPVEVKSGRCVATPEYMVQVCAQALCLEEMSGCSIGTGVLYFASKHRRVDVALTAELRDTTRRAAERMHELIREGETPIVRHGPKCAKCSLQSICVPGELSEGSRVTAYMRSMFSGA